MNTSSHENNGSEWASIGSAFHDIVRESRKQRVVIRNKSGKKILDLSILLVLILSIGAPILPAFVVMGVLLEAISVSFEKR